MKIKWKMIMLTIQNKTKDNMSISKTNNSTK